MTRPNVVIIDCATQEEVVREMNNEEFAAYEASLAAEAARTADTQP